MNRVDRLTQAPPTAGEARRVKDLVRVIDRLPAHGAVMIVGTHAVAPVMRQIIAERRGTEIAAATRVIIAPTERDEASATKNIAVPVFRDPFVREMREHAGALAQVWRH